MNSNIKLLLYFAIAVILLAIAVFAFQADASTQIPHYYEFGNWNYKECVQTQCGSEEGMQERYKVCNKLKIGWSNHGCTSGTVVSETVDCTVKEPVACEEEGICPTECGLEASEVADGQGGTKTCEATPACEIPVEPTKEIKKSENPDLNYSQGPDGITNDGKVKLKWDNFKDCSKVRIKIATDGVFGNGYDTIETEDDGSYWIEMDNIFWAKIRCSKSGSEYSDVEKITP